MVLVKSLKLFNLFILGKIDEQNALDDILHGKKGLVDNINIDFKKPKCYIFADWWSTVLVKNLKI